MAGTGSPYRPAGREVAAGLDEYLPLARIVDVDGGDKGRVLMGDARDVRDRSSRVGIDGHRPAEIAREVHLVKSQRHESLDAGGTLDVSDHEPDPLGAQRLQRISQSRRSSR